MSPELVLIAYDPVESLVLPGGVDPASTLLEIGGRERFPGMEDRFQAMDAYRFDQDMNMIVHHDEDLQFVAIAVEMTQGREDSVSLGFRKWRLAGLHLSG